MQSTTQFIRKNLLTFFIFLLFLFITNLITFGYWSYRTAQIDSSIIHPNILGKQLINQINQNKFSIEFDKISLKTLEENHIWAMVIDDKTGMVIWSKNLPKEISNTYSRKDIALFTRYYLKDYPVFTYINNRGLLVLGYPKDSYAKIHTNAFLLKPLRNLPRNILYYLFFNLIIIFIIYIISKRKLLHSINPITNAIIKISKGKKVQLIEKGDLIDIKTAVNKTSKQLRERDSMRVNWIAGISHDIRTPLSLIMGYANHLSQSKHLNETEKIELQLIQSNSDQIQNLVSNLNLTSRLEYNLVSMEIKKIHIIRVLREIIVDYMNHDTRNVYNFHFETNTITSPAIIYGDLKLLERAFRNIILNSMKHNPNGCQIEIKIITNNNNIIIDISDNGVGVSNKQLIPLNFPVNESIKKNSSTEKSHGLGLLIVKQIIKMHKGTIKFNNINPHGFNAAITLSLNNLNLQI